ncbi:2OG-Fe(II) oxygenase [Chondrinema litorale]|uniref:2OG-Fe(II) oxygenase n=1 Tax=Chondrinema litorale TaxID=2994555 RepID=UPI002542C3E0|nr:2OG-Fe(II) oxygenase [Chondrinema litorale]UZR92337.1 2OG-Fe(II) oxygenase [Chondrinema litorale]
MDILNKEYASTETVSKLKHDFDTALPYRHLVMDNFLSEEVALQAYENFPSVQELKTHWKGLNENKLEGSDFGVFHPVFSKIKEDFTSPEFYKWVSGVTGIDEVFITDDHMGSGIHQGTNGSFLDVHIDFNIHHIKNVHRRLNLLIYLEKNWKEEYGGALEMWNADMSNCDKMVLPMFNRCVIFETSEISYHGYSKITIPEDVTRKSFFAYFYTNERDGAVGYHDTVFKARPTESKSKKVKTAVKENLKNTAKATLKKLGVKF